ncbi:hypothetical protein HS088_TW07G01080 [Tripterygium wilfordii]|uniref:Dirigent protein n=1 Tax=Tripterygium wilfordii TaxID=458696 RepID=A0A7J7DGW3_TRIWF|nr:hypothetical protein HS088_TW07G01080 [Tripterygium wilfordii]
MKSSVHSTTPLLIYPGFALGAIIMIDDPLTVTQDQNSKLVGRAQGLYGSAGQTEFSLIMAVSLSFTDGGCNGSSLSISGTNPSSNPVRELPIVGGTGIFRMARGFAIARTVVWEQLEVDSFNAYVNFEGSFSP